MNQSVYMIVAFTTSNSSGIQRDHNCRSKHDPGITGITGSCVTPLPLETDENSLKLMMMMMMQQSVSKGVVSVGTDFLKQEVINCVNPQSKLNKQKCFLLKHKHKLNLEFYLQTQTLPVWTKSLRTTTAI